jgi:hypothetical protein
VSISGDVIRFEANASRIIESWGKVLDEAVTSASPLDNLTILDKEGKVILEQPLQPVFEGYPNVYVNRGHIQRLMLDYAISLGIKVNLGARVTQVFESDVSAGVQVGGKLHEADCVIAGDGVRSKTRAFVTGFADRPKKSGYAIYRTWFPLDVLRGDRVVDGIARSERPICKIWIAPESHAILTTNVNMQAGTCFLTHKASLSSFCTRINLQLNTSNWNSSTGCVRHTRGLEPTRKCSRYAGQCRRLGS